MLTIKKYLKKKDMSYVSPISCNFCEKCINSPKIDLGAVPPKDKAYDSFTQQKLAAHSSGFGGVSKDC